MALPLQPIPERPSRTLPGGILRMFLPSSRVLSWGWGLIDLPLRASSDHRFIVGALRARRTVCLLLRIFRRPRVARAQKIISPHLIPYPTHFLKGVAKVALDCARRTSTFLSCAFREHKGHLATPYSFSSSASSLADGIP